MTSSTDTNAGSHSFVVMLETGEAEEWQQVPVAVFDDRFHASRQCADWNIRAREFNAMFEKFPNCGVDIYWIQGMKFTLHEVAVVKLDGKDAL